MGKAARDKGQRGEREVAAILRSRGIEARRGFQARGGTEEPDVVHALPMFHFEVKRVERLNLHAAFDQAVRDTEGNGRFPTVLHRKSREPWLITMKFEDLLDLMKAMALEATHAPRKEEVTREKVH